MHKFSVTHEFACTPATYWKLNFDREVNDALYKGVLRFPDYAVQELRDTDNEIFRRTVATPKMDLPAAVEKVLGKGFKYTEETTFDKKTGRATFKGIPSTMADKLTTVGAMKVEPVGADRSRRTVEFSVDAKIMLVGGLMEQTAEKQMRDAYDKNATFINKWIADHGLTGK